MIEAVLFDLDGTLLDRDRSLGLFVEAQYDRLHEGLYHVPKARYVARFIELDARGLVWKDRVYQQLVAEFNIANLGWEALLEDYTVRFRDHCVPFAGLGEMLEGLMASGLKLGMVTNGRTAFQLATVRALGIEDYFRVLLISEREGVAKPNPEIFRRALARWGNEFLPFGRIEGFRVMTPAVLVFPVNVAITPTDAPWDIRCD